MNSILFSDDHIEGGMGVGLRSAHYAILDSQKEDDLKLLKEVDWFEALTENYLDTEGRPKEILLKARSLKPIGLHGVSLSIGSVDKPDIQYLTKLRSLIKDVDPFIVTDHLSWSKSGMHHSHDLIPIAFTKAALAQVKQNVFIVQDFLKREIALENISAYFKFSDSDLSEAQFISELIQATGCGLLLDFNNIYVNSINFKFDASDYIHSLPLRSVRQIHLAGHSDQGKFLFDTHSDRVSQAVWDLFSAFSPRLSHVPILLEWDQNIPPFSVLIEELTLARKLKEGKRE